MKQKIALIVFALLFIAQLWVPARLIFHSRAAAAQGVSFKFKCAPYDPRDLFRGHYLRLNLAELPEFTLPQSRIREFKANGASHGEYVGYFTFARDGDGFAQIKSLDVHPPTQGDPFLELPFRVMSKSGDGNTAVKLTLPFDRFYVNETDAPALETHMREAMRPGNNPNENYLIVAIADGKYVVQDLYISGVSSQNLLHPPASRTQYGMRSE